MAQAIGDRPVIHAGRDEIGGMSMAQIMRADPRELQALEPRIVVPIADVVLMERLTARPAKDQAIFPEPGPAAQFLTPTTASTAAVTRSIGSRARSRQLTLTFQYQPIAEPDVSGDGGRIQWVSGRPGEAPAYAGTDFIVAREGRIAAVYLFFDKLT